MAIKGVIFDYGGTIDSRGVHWSEIIWDGWKLAGATFDKNAFRKAYVATERHFATHPVVRPDFDFRQLMQAKTSTEADFLRADGHAADSHMALSAASYCYDRAHECVGEARPVIQAVTDRMPAVLVSNFYGNVESVLADFGLRHLFAAVIESAVAGVRKPDPQIFRLGVEALGLQPEEVLVVGDSLRKDILPAESIGCRTAWLKGKGWTDEEDRATHPSQISALADILTIIGKQ